MAARPVMPASTPRAMPDDLALLRLLEATIETLKTENEILKRRLAVAETWAAQALITNGSTSWRPSAPSRAAHGPAGGSAGGGWLMTECERPTPYDERPDLDLVAAYLEAHGLSVERFFKEETLTGKTPDFRVRRVERSSRIARSRPRKMTLGWTTFYAALRQTRLWATPGQPRLSNDWLAI